jgi:hypothetical protein
MKARIEKEAALGTRGRRSARCGRAETTQGAGESCEAAGDRQIAEIERTFTLRYEW